MAKRITNLITKNSNVVNRPLPSSLMAGEAIVNTAEGVVLYSGVSSSTNEWVPSGQNPNFFEVGSNLYDLKLRNKIISYGGVSGAALNGKLLRGSATGFELVDASTLSTPDTKVDTFVYANNQLTITQNGQADLTVTINEFSGLTVNGDSSVTGTSTTSILNANTINLGGQDILTLINKDVYVSGMTFDSSTGTLNLTGTETFTPLNVVIDTLPNIKLNNLTSGRVPFISTGGLVIDESGFEFDTTTNTLLADNINTSATGKINVGTGGLVVGSGGNVNTPGVGDLVVHGNLTIFGDSVNATTSELYIEDRNIVINYNPTSDTSSGSIGAGLTIQDGDGLNNDVTLEIRALNGLVGVGGNNPNVSEYTGPDGFTNRGFVTQLNDIIIRSDNTTTPSGVRVLAEYDELDGGTY